MEDDDRADQRSARGVTELANAARAGDVGETARELTASTKAQFRLLVASADVGAKHCLQVG